MCQSHPGPEITQEYLNSLAALANYTLPTPAALQATALPNGWEPVPEATSLRGGSNGGNRRENMPQEAGVQATAPGLTSAALHLQAATSALRPSVD